MFAPFQFDAGGMSRKDRGSVRVDLKAKAKMELKRLAKECGMTEMALFSRLLEWFAAQPWSIQREILMPDPATRTAVARALVEAWARGEG